MTQGFAQEQSGWIECQRLEEPIAGSHARQGVDGMENY